MTTGAMVFGAIPLVLSHDAGSEARHAIGIVLIGGLCIGTLFTLFVLPTIYFMISQGIAKLAPQHEEINKIDKKLYPNQTKSLFPSFKNAYKSHLKIAYSTLLI